MHNLARNFSGYANKAPLLKWPNGARVAVSLVVNYEEGAELSVGDGDERNEFAYEVFDEVRGVRDPCMESHFEYGTRVGYWRIADVLEQFSVPATFSCCGRAVERSPDQLRDAVARGHELACHGYRWESHSSFNQEEEQAIIQRSVDSIYQVTGQKPVGWHTRSAPSVNTRELLVEQGGFLYDSDAYNDDVPYLTEVNGKQHIVMPYSFDTNDMRFWGGGGFVQAEDFARYCIAAFDRLWQEGETAPRMLSIGLHLRIIGRPGRIAGLEMLLEHMQRKGGAWIERRDVIARHARQQLLEQPG